MKYSIQKKPIILLAFLMLFFACNDSGNDGPTPVEAQIASDIAANVNPLIATSFAPVSDIPGDTAGTGGYTFYDLSSGDIVTDSLSADWDIAFSATTILANSGHDGGIQIVQESYANLETAPETGFTGQIGGNGSWYDYTGGASSPFHAVIPKDDVTIVVKTPAGNYAKLTILSYYEGNPDVNNQEEFPAGTPSSPFIQGRPDSRYFTFNYSLNPTGATSLVHVDSFTYFDLTTGTVVEDESSSQWDIGLQSTTIIANSENGGGVQELNIDFSALTEAPIEGYTETNTTWYTYTAGNVPPNAILPNEGITLVFKTPDDEYAKVRILSYYLGNPDVTSPDFINIGTRSASRYYTFEYAVQTDGSRFFE